MPVPPLLSGDAQPRQCNASQGVAGRAPPIALGSLQNVRIADLRPTQFAVGFREVAHKRRRYGQASAIRQREMIEERPVPIVLGEGGRAFVLDRHHWLCALLAEEVEAAPTSILDDLSTLSPDAFWRTLDDRGWCRLRDADGHRRDPDAMPPTLAALQDDPFRSLASALRRRGGFHKADLPFSEFHWADLLRTRLDRDALVRDFDGALAKALAFASEWSGRPIGAGQLDGRGVAGPAAP